MKHISVFLIFFLLVLVGCQQTIKKGAASLPEIEVDAILEEKEIRIQDIAEDISYIPLETNDSMLLRGVFLSTWYIMAIPSSQMERNTPRSNMESLVSNGM